MPVKGLELIQRLKAEVQVASRAKHRAMSEEFGDLVRPDLLALGIDDLSNDAFDFFRKWRRDDDSLKRVQENSETSEGRQVFPALSEKSSRDPWLRFTGDQLNQLVMKHRVDFELKLSEFNSLKSRATHVSAIFRPFDEKYLGEWARYFDTYPQDAIRRQAEILRNEIIRDKIELHIWASDVYDLFRKAAVYSQEFEQTKSQSDSSRGEKKLPQGMIKSTSERIYGQQWRLWIRENEDQIVSFFEPTEARNSDFTELALASEVVSTLGTPKLDTPKRGSEISIKASVKRDPNLNATETWLNSDYSEAELINWLDLLESAWGIKEDHLNLTLTLRSEAKTSELNLRPMSLRDAAVNVHEIIDRWH